MDVVSVGSIPMGGSGGGDSGGLPGGSTGGTQQPPPSGARSSDFASRMERLNQAEGFGGGSDNVAPTQRRRAPVEEDPSRTDKAMLPGEGIDEGGDDLAELEPEQEAVESEYEDPQTVAKQEFLNKLAEQLELGKLPLDMLGEQLVPVPLENGREIEVPLNELRRGFLRQSDYTRKLHAITTIKSRAEHVLHLERSRNAQWQNEDVMIRDIMAMGLAEAFDRAVVRYATQQVQFRNLPQHEQQRILQNRQLENERAEHARQIAEYKAQLQKPDVQQQEAEVTAHFRAQLAQMLPAAFKEFGIRNYPTAHQKFLANLETLYQGGPCTVELVRAACSATKEELDDLAWRAQESLRLAPPKAGPRALAPGRLSGGAGRGVQQTSGNGQRRRPSDWTKKFNTTGM